MGFYFYFVMAVLPLNLVLAFIDWRVAKKKGLEIYDWASTRTSLILMFGLVVINLLLSGPIATGFEWVRHFALFSIGPDLSKPGAWLSWPMFFLVLADDFLYYAYHRFAHQSALFRRIHMTHHSSRHHNIFVAVRISWFEIVILVFWSVLVFVGFDPVAMVTVRIFNNQWNIFLHSRFVGSWGWLDHVLMTPTNHRVHHASNLPYRGQNYGSFLIIWDRLLGSYKAFDPAIPVVYEQSPLAQSDSVIEILGYGLGMKVGSAAKN